VVFKGDGGRKLLIMKEREKKVEGEVKKIQVVGRKGDINVVFPT